MLWRRNGRFELIPLLNGSIAKDYTSFLFRPYVVPATMSTDPVISTFQPVELRSLALFRVLRSLSSQDEDRRGRSNAHYANGQCINQRPHVSPLEEMAEEPPIGPMATSRWHKLGFKSSDCPSDCLVNVCEFAELWQGDWTR